MATLEDIIHLVAWNGYTQDVRQAVAVSKATWTDERIWYPFLIHHKYGPKERGRLQVILENKNQYMDDERVMKRIEELQSMAGDAGHMKRFLSQIDFRDNEGESPLTTAIKKHCNNAVKFLVENGADVNQVNKKGRSPLNLAKSMSDKDKVIERVKKPNGTRAFAEVKGDRNKKIVAYLTEKGAVDIPEVPSVPDYLMNNAFGGIYQRIHIIRNMNMHIHPVFNNDALQRYHDMPDLKKPKRMKASLYKQQFGKR